MNQNSAALIVTLTRNEKNLFLKLIFLAKDIENLYVTLFLHGNRSRVIRLDMMSVKISVFVQTNESCPSSIYVA